MYIYMGKNTIYMNITISHRVNRVARQTAIPDLQYHDVPISSHVHP
jgi:hypothetical protein